MEASDPTSPAGKVLIIDDDWDFIEISRFSLEAKGYRVFSAESAEEGWKVLEKEKPDLILMDLMMPFMDGWTTIQEIIKQGFEKNVTLSIITASGRADPEKMKGLEPFIHSYIQKPFDLERLVREVNDATRSLDTPAAE